MSMQASHKEWQMLRCYCHGSEDKFSDTMARWQLETKAQPVTRFWR